ncbi:hypothetical protein VULLAG_LOCUS8785 [Vulpes lagopus]
MSCLVQSLLSFMKVGADKAPHSKGHAVRGTLRVPVSWLVVRVQYLLVICAAHSGPPACVCEPTCLLFLPFSSKAIPKGQPGNLRSSPDVPRTHVPDARAQGRFPLPPRGARWGLSPAGRAPGQTAVRACRSTHARTHVDLRASAGRPPCRPPCRPPRDPRAPRARPRGGAGGGPGPAPPGTPPTPARSPVCRPARLWGPEGGARARSRGPRGCPALPRRLPSPPGGRARRPGPAGPPAPRPPPPGPALARARRDSSRAPRGRGMPGTGPAAGGRGAETEKERGGGASSSRPREQQIAPSQWQGLDEVAPNSPRPMRRQILQEPISISPGAGAGAAAAEPRGVCSILFSRPQPPHASLSPPLSRPGRSPTASNSAHFAPCWQRIKGV